MRISILASCRAETFGVFGSLFLHVLTLDLRRLPCLAFRFFIYYTPATPPSLPQQAAEFSYGIFRR